MTPSSGLLRTLSLAESPTEGLRRRGVMSLVGLVAQSAAKFLTNWLAGRLGGAGLLGTVSVGMSSAQLLTLLGPTSAGAAASKYLARAIGGADMATTRATARYIARLSVLTTIPLAAISAVLWLGAFGGDLPGALVVAGLTLALSGYVVARGMFFGNRHIGPAGSWDILTAAIGLAGAAALLLAGIRHVIVLAPLAASYALYTWAGWPRGARGDLSPDTRREIAHFVILNAAGTLASAGFTQGSLLAANAVGGRHGAGIYSSAFTLAAPLTIMVGAASSVLYPSMGEALGRGDLTAFRRQTHAATTAVTTAMAGAIGLLIVLGDPLITTVWGSDFTPAQALLPIMLTAVFCNAVSVPSTNALISRTTVHIRATAAFAAAGAGVGVLGWLVAIPVLGVAGVACGYLVSVLVTSGLSLVRCWREDGHRWGWLVLRACLTICAAVILWRLSHDVKWDALGRIATILCFAMVWTGLMWPEVKGGVRWARSTRRAQPGSHGANEL